VADHAKLAGGIAARSASGQQREATDVGWIIFLAIAVPLVAVVAWAVFDDSLVQIEPGQLGLLLVRGRATDRALEPGPHWVPALRRRMVQPYPSLELSFRTGTAPAVSTSELERTGPALHLMLGDRALVTVSYTVRFRLDQAMLQEVHNRFGPDGIWAAVRDETARTVRSALAQADVGLDDLFEPARGALERRVGDAVTAALAGSGFVVTMFSFGDLDLGRTGEVIQATARARLELAREHAEAGMRVARAKVDADLATYLAAPSTDVALRYREIDSWQQWARMAGFAQPSATRSIGAEAAVEDAAVQPVQDEQ
jgi:hypothetical protein